MSLIDYSKHYWYFTCDLSRQYRLAQLIALIVVISIHLSPLSPAIAIQSGQVSNNIDRLYLALSDALNFIFICHFLLRPFIHFYLLRRDISVVMIFVTFGYVLLLGLVQNAVTLGESLWHSVFYTHFQELLEAHQLSTIGTIQTHILFWGLATSGYFLFFVFWCVAYVVGQFYQDKQRLSDEVKHSKVELLVNQLNPHFLFNAFNSIRALIHEDPDKASDMVTQLSELFRTQLQADIKATNSLREEWTVAKRYLEIEKVRLEERLQLQVDIDETLWSQTLPTFSVLTLIENAVKHGIAQCIEPGMIQITATAVSGQRWQLLVENTTCDQGNALGTGTGLPNLEKRLALLYGEQGALRCQALAEKYRVTIELNYV
jgi:two-component system sensor histidine kinase AlgZ